MAEITNIVCLNRGKEERRVDRWMEGRKRQREKEDKQRQGRKETKLIAIDIDLIERKFQESGRPAEVKPSGKQERMRIGEQKKMNFRQKQMLTCGLREGIPWRNF